MPGFSGSSQLIPTSPPESGVAKRLGRLSLKLTVQTCQDVEPQKDMLFSNQWFSGAKMLVSGGGGKNEQVIIYIDIIYLIDQCDNQSESFDEYTIQNQNIKTSSIQNG